MKSVILSGMLGPYTEDAVGADIWCCSMAYERQKDASRIYNLDALSWFNENRPEYVHGVNTLGVPVIMQRHYPEIPKSEAYPLKEVLAFFGMTEKTAYFTSTIAWMMGAAIYEGYERITIHRIQESHKATDYFFQKPCLDFWCGVCAGRGIELMISEGSRLCQPHPWESGMYGYVVQDGADAVNGTITSAIKATAIIPVHFHRAEPCALDQAIS